MCGERAQGLRERRKIIGRQCVAPAALRTISLQLKHKSRRLRIVHAGARHLIGVGALRLRVREQGFKACIIFKLRERSRLHQIDERVDLARLSERACNVARLIAEWRKASARQRARKHLQACAQPTQRNAHLVDGFRQVADEKSRPIGHKMRQAHLDHRHKRVFHRSVGGKRDRRGAHVLRFDASAQQITARRLGRRCEAQARVNQLQRQRIDWRLRSRLQLNFYFRYRLA